MWLLHGIPFNTSKLSLLVLKSPKSWLTIGSQWNETGTCRFNESCRYDHIRDPNHAQAAKDRNLQRENDNNKYKSNDISHFNSHPITKYN